MDSIFKWFQYAIYTNKNYYEISTACTVWTVFMIIKVQKKDQEASSSQEDSGLELKHSWKLENIRSQGNFS